MLCNWVLAQDSEESCGPAEKYGDKAVHQIVPPIWWIFFTWITTYLQDHISGCLSSNSHCVWLRASQMCSNMPLCSQSEAIVSKGSIGIRELPWQPVGLGHSEGYNFSHSGPTCSLHNDWVFYEYMWHFGVKVVFQKMHPVNTQCKSHLEWKYVVEKDPSPKEPRE